MDIYLSTVAMEKNRWSTHQPSYEVSAFLPRLFRDGFRGIELWENHLFLASEAEQQRLLASGVPVIYVGDSVRAGKVITAVRDGFEAAYRL